MTAVRISVPFLTVLVASAVLAPAPASAQSETEAVMVAAARWAVERMPAGEHRVDPHRTGDGPGQAVAARIAAAVGARLGTLEEARRCADRLDPGSCSLAADAVLAIAAPNIRGDRARVRVYAWYRSGRSDEPVARESWTLVLSRSGTGWSVVGVDGGD